ncbi:bifunctional 2-polyprenyl-6-hydroxyphenol methylase/3-demethylubiquinol 3-O-methyltransferase UbiG [Blochmannia endosymbiont of Camponotus (Colobopsis) obliquus]|uniref:bifunctional 2-polyprenyl-6-hydroxyphenol methylase/3-demethylubiquinol 3-O-methyltransferase UbiG n=1 Tax=Blochmannia endosymbiont of Camponotus (Colobopsis) obliquus TaxID=1505597 RepID=UPI00061A7B1E|nr:bifunctional 2-polyprenyl-6-hydroxyphenol methylase/3-demethylubiquinol 3-O-methyltransferase UbiG [Blochmannia endosymbiont of Camponotus (Colobopsis) obliquus]AKC60629.1 3-demethylubiquinone-9 3-methyltransferase [Blochmannia endosymbiont of Camponotus (Colobopsis) obliquus]
MKNKINNTLVSNKNNIDLDEINKFNDFAHLWWNKKDKFSSLHKINPLRLNYILERSHGLFGKKILDIGCGGGILTESMAQEGAEVTGIDVAKKLLKIAHTHALENDLQIKYFQQTIEQHIQEYQSYYDIITCLEILEHVPNPLSLIQSCAIAVKHNGQVFFSTLNRNFKSWLYVILGAEYLFQLLPKGTHNFHKFIKPSELLDWANNSSLYEQHIIGIHYNPLCNHFYFKSDITLNYIIHTKHIKNSTNIFSQNYNKNTQT